MDYIITVLLLFICWALYKISQQIYVIFKAFAGEFDQLRLDVVDIKDATTDTKYAVLDINDATILKKKK